MPPLLPTFAAPSLLPLLLSVIAEQMCGPMGLLSPSFLSIVHAVKVVAPLVYDLRFTTAIYDAQCA